MEYTVVLITSPDEQTAAKIANCLVEKRLAACINIIAPIRSIYKWEGKIEDDKEVLMIVKTRKDLFEELESSVKQMHPYSVPEIIGLPIIKGSSEYLNWITEVTS